MEATANNSNPEIQAFSVSLEANGQVTVPVALREQLQLSEGDQLTLIQVGDLVLLSPKALAVPQLVEQISALREAEGISLSELLDGLQAERQALWEENQPDA
jgi:AbrB family looped-hinge helix DNA binding protein